MSLRRVSDPTQEQNKARLIMPDHEQEGMIGFENFRGHEGSSTDHHTCGCSGFGSLLVDVSIQLLHLDERPRGPRRGQGCPQQGIRGIGHLDDVYAAESTVRDQRIVVHTGRIHVARDVHIGCMATQGEKRPDGDDGVGLGLSLAREIIVAHGGQISVGESADGLTEFEVILPLE